MSTLALTATYTVTAVIGMAAMYVPARLARYDARAYNALAEDKLTACEARDAAFEETRNKPWYWPTGPHVTGELLAVEHHDVPAIAAEPHHDDEDAPAEDTDRKGMWRVLLGLASDLVDRVHDWLPNLLRQWRERNKFGSGEQATDVDPFEQFRIDDSPRGRCHPRTDAEIRAELAELTGELPALPLVLSPAEVAAIDEQRAQWVALNPPTNHGPDGQRHWNDVTAMHGIVTPGRHAKMPINPVPTQRDGGDLDV